MQRFYLLYKQGENPDCFMCMFYVAIRFAILQAALLCREHGREYAWWDGLIVPTFHNSDVEIKINR